MKTKTSRFGVKVASYMSEEPASTWYGGTVVRIAPGCFTVALLRIDYFLLLLLSSGFTAETRLEQFDAFTTLPWTI